MIPIGLYIHIPFCERKCYYCDFNSYSGENTKIQAYLEALLKEIAFYKDELKGHNIKTIFIGGGTPSLMDGRQVDELMNNIYRNYSLDNRAEITIESNPGTLNIDKLQEYRKAGVNRLSVGLQACQDHLLKKLGRIHNYKEFINNIEIAKKVGFSNINVDLMFGLPGQTLDEWKLSLDEIVNLDIPHISAYSLIWEEGTPFYKAYQEQQLMPLEEELELKMFHFTMEYLKENKYHHYEISNYAKRNFECQHNHIYWKNQFYLGLGAGGHSYLQNRRFYNEGSIDGYLRMIKEGRAPVEENIKLTRKDEISETMFLGLRLMEGISIETFSNRFGESPFSIYGDKLEKLKRQELITYNQEKIQLTPKGIDLANLVFTEMLLD
ncbi:radical SAM family heme chaperone HemW [Alkaliphilus peptidifermentans]|uniref:Heme chaperone HemW n=1 Tax=Alkaliphilus peptidifermentans DSM 18978 TaxID=1120976 RepID=A0A1G5BXB3_9FIRM|nr:radical SAM family heme chaperone HemW [Alkaliphilus peptidifermentans]SCX94842.1 coproporphyrinogen III oxidase, anaerobic [Alkaliphilus peptidifermentans DSM 18978]